MSDLQTSFEFYRDLGFELTAEQHGNGAKHYSFSVGDITFEIYPAKNGAVSRIRLGIKVSASSKLVEFLGAEERKLLRDPDGNVLELRRF
ncbi:MAG: hypothetical protein HC799_17675 [Limnothrix sp. RL_2_0]|nr:hypothetical protein [Limnothrix sp. RL_2_0]